MLQRVHINSVRWLLIAIPDVFEAGQLIEHARLANATIDIIARAHTKAQRLHLKKHGVANIIIGEREIDVRLQ